MTSKVFQSYIQSKQDVACTNPTSPKMYVQGGGYRFVKHCASDELNRPQHITKRTCDREDAP